MKRLKSLIFTLIILFQGSVFCQESDNAHAGWKVKNDNERKTVWRSKGGEPDLKHPLTLSSDFFFTVSFDSNEMTEIAGKKYIKISIPGSPCSQTQDTGDRVINCSDFGKDYWIALDQLSQDSETVNNQSFRKEFYKSRWSIGVLTVPFKYRLGTRKNESSIFSGESSIGPSLGYNLWKRPKLEETLTLVGSAGITVINPNQYFEESTEDLEKNMAGFTVAIGLVLKIKNGEAGIVAGMDLSDRTWEYHADPWISLAVGYSFFNPDTNAKNK